MHGNNMGMTLFEIHPCQRYHYKLTRYVGISKNRASLLDIQYTKAPPIRL